MHRSMALLLVGFLLAGCADGPAPAEQDDGPTVVTDPRDLAGGNSSGEHLHDYWGGQDRLTLIEDIFETGYTWNGESLALVDEYPPSGTVVPQGTASVEVTMSWPEPEAPEGFSDPELWVQTAADSEPRKVAPLENGVPVVFEVGNDDNDLPHQQLSAWRIQMVVYAWHPVLPIQYSQDITVYAVAHRGLEIPLYPGHPDRWDGATEFHLFDDADVQQVYSGESYSGQWSCFGGCPLVYTPTDGVVIPTDAHRVEVTLELAFDTPFVLGLAYHASDSREWKFPAPASEEGTTRHYILSLEGAMGDGPYAQQSLWRFAPYVEGPQQDGWTVQEYSITADVYRHPA